MPRQFDLMLAATITLPHLLVSSEMSLPKSADDPESAVPAKLASRALNFGSAMLMLKLGEDVTGCKVWAGHQSQDREGGPTRV